jgi:NADH:ubiquinone oxidoreductase subunit K
MLSNYSIGFIYALLLIGVAATDTAVGLGLFILYFKTSNKVSIL